MTLNPQIGALLEMMAQMPKLDYATSSVAEVRAAFDQRLQIGAPPEVASVRDIDIPLAGRTVQARLYIPLGSDAVPALTLYYHGGGWVVGTLDTHDATCRALARESRSALLSIGYRLAPEHPFPAPLDDCYDALTWAVENAGELGVDGSRVAVAGDSAGGNLAAAVAILCRDKGGPVLRHQCLIYPVTDDDFSTPSYAQNGGGDYFLSEATMRWFWDQYVGPELRGHAPLATVLNFDNLAGLAPATVLTAEYDPLRDEGMAYAERLAAAGVPVDAAIAPGMIHGFFSLFEAVPDAMPWVEQAGRNLSSALRP